MIDSRIDSTVIEKNVLLYLKSQQRLAGSSNIEIKSAGISGVLYLRKGRVIAAEWGILRGNGALLNLCSVRNGEIRVISCQESVERNLFLTLSQVERILTKLSDAAKNDIALNEEEQLALAVSLFYQFRWKEAGVKLVQILKNNRFFYPAWLWYSRLMTRDSYIRKALVEARKWGNCDLEIKQEYARIEPLLIGSDKAVKRCFFCWSPVGMGEERCAYCSGLLRIPKKKYTGEVKSKLLWQALMHYQQESEKNPENTRTMYCLCLGFYSLGRNVQAREYIARALKISPREPLFIKTAAFLRLAGERQKKVNQEEITSPARVAPFLATQIPMSVEGGQKIVLVVEDSKTSRKVISMLLARKKYQIIEAMRGSEVFTQTEKIVPDLVLLDVMLPDMTGYEVLAQLKKDSRFEKVPVVMLTGKNSAVDRLRGLKGGADEYLTKPFNPERLLEVIAKYLGDSKLSAPAKVIKPEIASGRNVSPVVTPPPVPAFAAHVFSAKKVGKSVLVVEDSPTTRKVISMILSRRGYEVREAVAGAEALNMVGEEQVDLILLDVLLPDMTGFDILDSLKGDERLNKIPVVMLTGKKGAADREKGIRAGAVEYLTKPFDPDKLVSVIHDHITKRHQ